MSHSCHITSVHSHLDTRIFFKQCKSLVEFGYVITLVVCCDHNDVIHGVKLLALPKPRNRLRRMIHTTWQAYKQGLKTNAEVYHFHDPELLPIGLLLKLRGKQVIYDVHEDVPRQILGKHYIPKPLRSVMSKGVELLEFFIAQRLDAVICATPCITRRFQKIGCRTVNVNNYPIPAELHCAETNWFNKEHAVCYVGGIKESRSIFEMVEAIGQTDAKLLLAGQFSQPEQRHRAMNLPGWVNVQELGHLNRSDVAAMMGRARAGLVLFHPGPNHAESQPNKMFEYMSAGIPVIASDFPLWREIVEGNDCGICVDPRDSSAIRDAINYLLAHPDEAEHMGHNGRKAVETRYNWETEAKKLKALYEELLS